MGSVMLGLFDDEANLRYVSVAARFTAVRRAELLEEVASLLAVGRVLLFIPTRTNSRSLP